MATDVEISSIPGFELAGAVDDVGFGAHGGVRQLQDGRAVFADTLNGAIVALAIGADGTPTITDRVGATLGGGIAWMAASPTRGHVAVGSLQDSEESQVLNKVAAAADRVFARLMASGNLNLDAANGQIVSP